jgi:adenosylmethionine-8-amino-7-oxononanoate aminotransferase
MLTAPVLSPPASFFPAINGHGVAEIADAVAEQLRTLAFTPIDRGLAAVERMQ